MAALIVAIGFPELMAAMFVLLYFAYRSAGNPSALDDHGFFWYPAMLAVPFVVTLAGGGARHAIGDGLTNLGGAGAPLWALGGVALGLALYVADATSARSAPAARARRARKTTVMEGRFAALERFRPPAAVFLVLALFVVVAEEAVWRGFLIRALPRYTVVPLAPAVVLAALAYGCNHYYFGLRNVAMKAFMGLVWGIVFVQTNSLLVPLVSHMTFEVIAGRQYWQRRGVARVALQR
jgi:membrane protease YdiL (CAAX protease family)